MVYDGSFSLVEEHREWRTRQFLSPTHLTDADPPKSPIQLAPKRRRLFPSPISVLLFQYTSTITKQHCIVHLQRAVASSAHALPSISVQNYVFPLYVKCEQCPRKQRSEHRHTQRFFDRRIFVLPSRCINLSVTSRNKIVTTKCRRQAKQCAQSLFVIACTRSLILKIRIQKTGHYTIFRDH
jgi:hypothetical protein